MATDVASSAVRGDLVDGRKKILFVTRFGLSDRTAIGVQTRFLLTHFPDYLHVYWNEGLFDPLFPRSRRIESWVFSRVPFLKRDNAISKLAGRIGAGNWEKDKASPTLVSYLKEINHQLSSVYLAPIDAKDAIRMKEIVSTLQLPFVLHLWDMLDNEKGSDATIWLMRNAAHVFCLNQQLLAAVQPVQPRASILTFMRAPGDLTARHEENGDIKIAIMGDIGSYRDGVQCLVRAGEILRARGVDVTIVYVGRKKSLKLCQVDRHEFVKATGFLRSAKERDSVLLKCNIGFVPGPIAEPTNSSRSKFSIPSRILDYLALSLPVVGIVHPESATSLFCRELGVDGDLAPIADPEQVCERILSVALRENWDASSRKSAAAFKRMQGYYSIDELKRSLIGRVL